MMARPTKLTPELQEKILQAVRAGNYIETAAVYAGINKTTLYDWLKRGARAKSGKFREFSNALEKALAEAEVRDVAIIAKAAQEQWQAAAWRLERKYPCRWGRRDKLEHTAKVTVERDDSISKLGQEVLKNPKLAQLATEFFAELASGGLGEDDASGTGEYDPRGDMAVSASPEVAES